MSRLTVRLAFAVCVASFIVGLLFGLSNLAEHTGECALAESMERLDRSVRIMNLTQRARELEFILTVENGDKTGEAWR